jgi:hypothetical protein
MLNEITLSTGQCTCMNRNPVACGTTTLKTIGRWIIADIHLVTAIIRKLFIQNIHVLATATPIKQFKAIAQ